MWRGPPRDRGSADWTSPFCTPSAPGRLPGDHRDPFDRMLIAQAQLEDVPIVSNDIVFDTYGVNRIW